MKISRQTILNALVRQLQESYPRCNASNVLTDQIYSAFAKASLEETIENAGEGGRIGRMCRQMISDIENNKLERKVE